MITTVIRTMVRHLFGAVGVVVGVVLLIIGLVTASSTLAIWGAVVGGACFVFMIVNLMLAGRRGLKTVKSLADPQGDPFAGFDAIFGDKK